MNAPISLAAVFAAHQDAVLAPRDDGTILHASDLHACAYALHLRLAGTPALPFDDGTFANFERGHAVEARLYGAFLEQGYNISRGEEVAYEGVVGNLDFVLYDDDEKPQAIIDLSTTAKKTPDWSYGHALKSAFYAVAKGAPLFCEWVFCYGFGGLITNHAEHWFAVDDVIEDGSGRTWRDAVAAAIVAVKQTALIEPMPEPPVDPRSMEHETWRCGKPGSGKSYCQARCPRNARYDATAEEHELV